MGRSYIFDATVLIDYCKSDPLVLRLFSRRIGSIHIPRPVFDEVHDLDEEDCTRFGLQIVEPSVEQLLKAAAMKGPLSFQDWVCLFLAVENEWICVTNDRKLTERCKEKNVQCVRGLVPLVLLVQAGAINPQSALKIAIEMHKHNPKYVHKNILEQFRMQIKLR